MILVKNSKYFRAFFLTVKETLVLLFDDILVFKEGFLDFVVEKLAFFRRD